MNPAAASRNLHHTMAYRSEEEFWDDQFGKGPFDPDVVGYYPGQEIGPATHDYPLTLQTAIIVDNEFAVRQLPF